MEFYTIDPTNNYGRTDVIEDFESSIWTERFIDPGDFKIVVPASHERLKQLAPGTMVAIKDSRIVMMVDTREVADGMMTVSGKSLETFLANRVVSKFNSSQNDPEAVLSAIAQNMQGQAFGYIPDFETSNGYTTWTGGPIKEKIPAGDAYSALLTVARKYQHDLILQLRSPFNINGFDVLQLRTYLGIDRSSTQSGSNNQLVRFSPDLDNLAEIKELFSNADHKNMVMVLPPELEGMPGPHPAVFAQNGNDALGIGGNAFDKRYIQVTSDATAESIAYRAQGNDAPLWPSATWYNALTALMNDQAKTILREHRKKKLIDGEVTPNSPYRYGFHYFLGDKVDVEGNFSFGGLPVKAVVKEHIRSQDSSGERSYPALDVNPEITLVAAN